MNQCDDAGQPAFVDFISSTKVNTSASFQRDARCSGHRSEGTLGSHRAFPVIVKPTEPGLLAAPHSSSRNINMWERLFPMGTLMSVLWGHPISGFESSNSRQHNHLYGVGFDTTVPSIPAGQIVSQTNQVSSTFQSFFGGTGRKSPTRVWRQTIQACINLTSLFRRRQQILDTSHL